MALDRVLTAGTLLVGSSFAGSGEKKFGCAPEGTGEGLSPVGREPETVTGKEDVPYAG